MKYFLTLLIAWVALLNTFWVNAAYDLTDSDFEVLDIVGEKILDFVDAKPELRIEAVIILLEDIQDKRSLSDKSEALIEVLIADMYWYAGYDEEGGEEMYETLTAADCYEDEYFDAEDERCYITDGSDDETDEDNDTDYGYDTDYDDESHFSDSDVSEEDIEAVYRTDPAFTLQEGQATDMHTQVWETFTEMFPERLIAFIDVVQFYTDDEWDTAAYVERTSDDNSTWLVTFNLSEVTLWDNDELFIHEMGHILTLEQSQVSASTPEGADEAIIERHADKCTTHYVYEGCLSSSSYFYKFVGKFWSEEMLDAIENEENVYEGNESEFVTDYAATNPGEDLAETFAFFVTKPTQHEVSEIAGEKIDFMYGFPELVHLRTYIRNRLSGE